MKVIKKVFGILLVIFSGLFCVSACICFLATITGMLDIPTIGETVASAIFFAIFALISAFITKLGWYLWKGKKISDLLHQRPNPQTRDAQEKTVTIETEELELQDEEKRKKLRSFLLEDRSPFAASGLENFITINCRTVQM